MMFYKNIVKNVPKIKYSNIKINFSNNFDCDNYKLNSQSPQYCINFDTNLNQLTNSYGENTFMCSVSENGDGYVFPKIGEIGMLKHLKFFTKTDANQKTSKRKMIVEDINSNVYYSHLDDGTSTQYHLTTLDENCESKYFDYCDSVNNYLLIATKVNNINKLYVYDGDVITIYEDIPYIFDICSFNDYICISVDDGLRNKVYFYNDTNPYNLIANLSNMQSVILPIDKGKILKLINFEDYLYVVCEYGIVKILCYKNQETFEIEDVYMGFSRIIENSVVVGGDNIFFTDDKAIYLFNGLTIKRINLNIYFLFNDTYKFQGSACFSGGKYYLATKLGNYSDGVIEYYDNQKNNALIVYDISTDKLEVCIDISIKEIETYYDKSESRVAILAGYNRNYYIKTLSKNGKYNTNYYAKKYYKTHEFDLNSDSKKIVRELSIYTQEDINFNLLCDNKTYKYLIKGDNKIQRIILNKKAKKFAIEIKSETENPLIKNLELLVGVYG